jgi:hypothetical protein
VRSTQASTLLPALFEQVDEERPLVVLETGPAMQETVDFLSGYRCRLHVLNLYSELPIEAGEEGSAGLHERFEQLLQFPPGTVFDLCLFWDLFNYLDRDAVLAFVAALRPYLRKGTLAHGFGLHNLNAPRSDLLYGIGAADALCVRPREQPLPGYHPHNQGKLKNMLYCFNFVRSVLLSDGRLELLLRASP